MRVIGLIKVINQQAFEIYRSQVAATIIHYGGEVMFRGRKSSMLWNELFCQDFDNYVEIKFPSLAMARQWATGAEYLQLLEVRKKAMRLTLFFLQDAH